MGISAVVQAKVALVLRLIHRLTERTKHHGLNNRRIITIGKLSQHGLIVLRGRLITPGKVKRQLTQERAQICQPLCTRPLVDTVEN